MSDESLWANATDAGVLLRTYKLDADRRRFLLLHAAFCGARWYQPAVYEDVTRQLAYHSARETIAEKRREVDAEATRERQLALQLVRARAEIHAAVLAAELAADYPNAANRSAAFEYELDQLKAQRLRELYAAQDAEGPPYYLREDDPDWHYHYDAANDTETLARIFESLREPIRRGVAVWTEPLAISWNSSRALALVRDIFRNPFRPVAFSPAWRTDTAVALARQMYESREFGAMPILADALQDAGCDSDDILSHCRDTSLAHVRGCWVVDLILGKA